MRVRAFGAMKVFAAASTTEMAERAAEDFAAAAAELLRGREEINVVFSGAESQGAFHAALCARRGIPWERINAFAVDEFLGAGIPDACAVSAQPRRDLYGHVRLKSVNVIDPAARDAAEECRRYGALVAAHPPHISCLGIGVSGHIALNEPGDTDFDDSMTARIVRVAEASKRQLASDPNFRSLPAIPDKGISLTIPILTAASTILVVVPYALKASIVGRLEEAPVSPALPASILKERPNARLYLDNESSRSLPADGWAAERG